jgi:CRP-like cAMP-binding protein
MTAPRPPSLASQVLGTSGRLHPRIGADFPLELYSGEYPGPLLGRTRDLGVGGACVATASPFAFKSLQRVVLSLPERRLELLVEGRWQRDLVADDLVLTGIGFLDPPEDVVESLWELVLEGSKELARFLYTRSDLADFALEETMGLAQVTRFREISAGRCIYRQDRSEPGEDSIFVISDGTVGLQVRVRDARDATLDRLGPGRIFGGLPLVAEIENAESAVAETNVRLLEIDRQAFAYLLAAKPWLALRLAQAVVRAQAHRVRELLHRIRHQL